MSVLDIVIYWPSTEPSIKRCACVNKRMNSGSRWTLDNNITRCPDGSSQLEKRCRIENQLQTEGFAALSDPRLSNPAKMRKKCCYGRGRSWVNIAVCPCLHSSLTHHRNIENKVWEIYIFIKKCVRSFIEVRILCLIMFLLIFVLRLYSNMILNHQQVKLTL